jgi:hypothetical protein
MSNKDIAPITQGAVEANGGVIEVVSDIKLWMSDPTKFNDPMSADSDKHLGYEIR